MNIICVTVAHLTDAGFQSRAYYKEGPMSRNSKANYNIQNDVGREKSKNLGSDNIGAKSSKGSGLSAWGIIGLIIAAIMLATSGYYAFVFYPYLCKKERNYDIIELSNVV